jgi:hypothetical protein
VIRSFEAGLTGTVHFYPDYDTTGSLNRRLTWNPRISQWEDTSEPGFTCDPAIVKPAVRGNGDPWQILASSDEPAWRAPKHPTQKLKELIFLSRQSSIILDEP